MILNFIKLVGSGANSDGITGQSSNGTITNIYGYTNDDLVAISAGSQFGGIYTNNNVSNVIINNIRPGKRDSSAAWHGVAVYAIETLSITDIYISNVVGDTQSGGVYVSNSYPTFGVGYFDNINISNVDGKVLNSSPGIITFNQIIANVINVSNCTRVETSQSTAQILNTLSTIASLNINNINIDWQISNNSAGQVVADTGSISSVNLSNIISKNLLGTSTPTLYLKNATSDTTTVTLLKGSGIHCISGSGNQSEVIITSGKVAVDSFDILADKTTLTPIDGCRIRDIAIGACCYELASLAWWRISRDRSGYDAGKPTTGLYGGMPFWSSSTGKIEFWNGSKWLDSLDSDPYSRGSGVAVTSGATSKTITLNEHDSNYVAMCSPNWGTTWWVTAKTTTSFVLNFGTVAPTGAIIDWFARR